MPLSVPRVVLGTSAPETPERLRLQSGLGAGLLQKATVMCLDFLVYFYSNRDSSKKLNIIQPNW